MTELAEGVLIGMVLEHDKNDCPFCVSNEKAKPNPVPVSKGEASWEEDADKLIGNDAGELENNMSTPRPQDWYLEDAVARELNIATPHKITPNPHHLIPGNEALKQVPTLLPWIFEDKGKIENDIGYDVNNGENGIWLPSNNSMRGVSWWSGDTQIIRKAKYAKSAMKVSGGLFHDRHIDPYSEFVQKILNKIADRMNGLQAQDPKCPYKVEKGESTRYKPPYALVNRLNGVSRRLSGYLKTSATPTNYIYTSKLVKKAREV